MGYRSCKDEELSMGEKALFIEHPTDKTNRVKPQDLDKSQLPQGDPTNYHIQFVVRI